MGELGVRGPGAWAPAFTTQVETIAFPKDNRSFLARVRREWRSNGQGVPSTPLWRVFTDAPEAYTVKGRTPDGEVTLSEGQAGTPVDIDATSEAMQEVNALSVVSGDGGALLPETSGTSATCWPVYDWANEYFMTDHLGTVRGVYEITQNYGEAITGPWVKAWKDYEPFGFELYAQVPQQTSGTRFEFTGHERDEREGGFDTDYMRFRFYGDSIGRFLRPDNISGSPYNPQSWNLYSYVRGNPVNFNDPTGHEAKREESKHQRVVEERPPNIGDAQGGDSQVSTEGEGEAADQGQEGVTVGDVAVAVWDFVWVDIPGVVGSVVGDVYDSMAHPEGNEGESSDTTSPNEQALEQEGFSTERLSGRGEQVNAELKDVAVTGSTEGTSLALGLAAGRLVTKIPVPGLTAKEAAKDVPSWAKGARPFVTESGKDFAKRLSDAKYGVGNYGTYPGSEFSKIKKWGDRAFKAP